MAAKSGQRCRRQSIQSREATSKSKGAKSKSRGAKFFIEFSPEKHALCNAITSINNSLMQSKIILIGVTSSELRSVSEQAISVIISNKIPYCLFQQGGLGERCKLPSGIRGGALETKAFLGFT